MEYKEKILKEYDLQKETYNSLGSVVANLLPGLWEKKGIKCLPIVPRLKLRKSLAEKIDRKANESKTENRNYTCLGDITDVMGVRIITYLDRDVMRISELVQDAFEIDRLNSVDKYNYQNREFGYRSMHFIVSIKKNGLGGHLYEQFAGLKIEIQIRTVLQHAWAEIEHDLGYKSKKSIPAKHKRDFSRISALLELGDREFDRLRKDLAKYERGLPKEIKEENTEILIDQASLKALVNNNERFKHVQNILRTKYNAVFINSERYDELIDRLEFLGIDSVSNILESLRQKGEHFERFVYYFFDRRGKSNYRLVNTAPLFYYLHFLASAKGREFFQRYRDFGNDKGYKVVDQSDFVEIYSHTEYETT